MRATAAPALLSLFLLTACGGAAPVTPLLLASHAASHVEVEIFLAWQEDGTVWLEATFTPEAGCHLYSKDLPPGGVDGLGRPTLLELVPGSALESAGELSASIPSQVDEDNPALLVYPEGAVSLRQPVHLPPGEGWIEAQVAITYMACRSGTCFAPAVGELITVRIPRAGEVLSP